MTKEKLLRETLGILSILGIDDIPLDWEGKEYYIVTGFDKLMLTQQIQGIGMVRASVSEETEVADNVESLGFIFKKAISDRIKNLTIGYNDIVALYHKYEEKEAME